MYTVYIRIKGDRDSSLRLVNADGIDYFAYSPNPGGCSLITTHGFFSLSTEHNDPNNVISYIGYAKKLSEQTGLSIILDLTESIPKIEKLRSPPE